MRDDQKVETRALARWMKATDKTYTKAEEK